MNKKFLIIYTTFASLVFAFAIFFFSFNIYKEYNTGIDTVSYRFYNISNNINNGAQKNSSYLSNNIENLIADFDEIEAINISINGKNLLSYPTSNFQSINSKYIRNFSSKLDTPSGNIKIEANIYVLKPNSVFYYAKLSFLIVLIITLTTIIMIIYLNHKEKKGASEVISEKVESEDEIAVESQVTEDSDDSIYSMEEEIINEDEIIPEETPFELIESETSVDSDEVYESSDEEEIKLPYEEYTPAAITSETSEPYNPDSGISWEKYLKERLETELSRAISSETDLSLFVFQIPEVEHTSELFNNICKYLTIQFEYKDLLFEYKDNCIVAIKIGMKLDDALTFCDKVHADIKSLIEDKECYIGISTRSVRMVSTERLLLEAEEALKHAKDEPASPVVAFRVDAEKYREYMEKNQDQ